MSILIAGYLLIILSLGPSAQAIEYDQTEDFTDPLSSDWHLRAEDWSQPYDSGSYTIIEDTWSVTNGYLESTGVFSPQIYNLATLWLHDPISSIRLDAYTEGGAQDLKHNNWWIIFSDPEAGQQPGSDSHGLYIFVNRSSISLHYIYSDHQIANQVNLPQELQGVNSWKHYDFVLTKDMIYGFLESQKMIQFPIKENTFDFKYVSIITHTGSHERFDNIQITANSNGILNEIQQQNMKTVNSTYDDLVPPLELDLNLWMISATIMISHGVIYLSRKWRYRRFGNSQTEFNENLYPHH